jgi:protein phosphatase
MKLHITASSRVGLVREQNEDMLLVGDTFIRESSHSFDISLPDYDRFMMALADGMGGHNSGEIASSDVLHNLQYYYSDIPTHLGIGDFNEDIYEWLTSINHIIEAKGRADAQFKDMGTTLVALAYYDGEFYWMNCGDSRLYRLHQGALTQMTSDHSLSNLMGSKVHSSVITNCIGGGCSTSYIDIVKCTEEIVSGDMFLLCSDGLSDMVDDARITRLLSESADANRLCDAAIEEGGLDNVSACLVTIK